MEKIALLLLTMMMDGATRLTLVEVEDPADCEARRARLEMVLKGAGMTVVEALCGPTDLALTPYVHGTPREEETHRYRVEVDASGAFEITPVPDWAICAGSGEGETKVYCAVSSQVPEEG